MNLLQFSVHFRCVSARVRGGRKRQVRGIRLRDSPLKLRLGACEGGGRRCGAGNARMRTAPFDALGGGGWRVLLLVVLVPLPLGPLLQLNKHTSRNYFLQAMVIVVVVTLNLPPSQPSNK